MKKISELESVEDIERLLIIEYPDIFVKILSVTGRGSEAQTLFDYSGVTIYTETYLKPYLESIKL